MAMLGTRYSPYGLRAALRAAPRWHVPDAIDANWRDL
jgi:hypothetical protein